MHDGISMSYGAMDQTCSELTAIVREIIEYKKNMMTKVDSLCDTWKSAASEKHREDFMEVEKQIDLLTDLAEQLVSSVKQYREDMAELDSRYA